MLKAILKKEFTQFRRNSFLPKLVIAFPIMIMLVMPLVANMEVKNVNVAIVDNDGSTLSHQLAQRIGASQNLTLEGSYVSHAQAMARVEESKADIIVGIPAGYEKSLASADKKEIYVAANSVNGTKGSLGMLYVVQTIAGGSMPGSIRFLYNDTLNYRYFMIPALMIMLIIMICGFLPALNIVGEKEKGTIEQINVTPVSKITFTMGKLLPYWIIGIVVLTVAMVIAWLAYGLKPQGSLLAIYLAAWLFIVFMSSLGVIIANNSDNMQQAMFVMFFFVVVFILMSGLMTPVQSMPHWAQTLTYAIPPRFFIDIMRATYLKGTAIGEQALWYGILALYSASCAALAMLSYRKQS